MRSLQMLKTERASNLSLDRGFFFSPFLFECHLSINLASLKLTHL